jgi:L-ectoine synthase
MKVIDVNTLEGVAFTGGTSYRPVLASDNMGFSVCKTVIPKGKANHWHYKNHLEACYCIEGTGILTNLETNEVHYIRTDVIYVLDKHDNHTFQALENTILISIFNPPLKGNESHDENGNYI